MVAYIKKPSDERDQKEGGLLLLYFAITLIVGNIFRNRWIHDGFGMMITLRRTLVGVLFDKVARLSSKSMAETNSGKLISLVSADLFEAERGTAFVNNFLASPFINLICYGFLASSVGWLYMLVVFGCWIALMFMQWAASEHFKARKIEMAGLTD